MNRVKNKLRSTLGETLAETLVALLIISLASVLLAFMTGASSNMNLRAKKYDKDLDKALTDMITASPSIDSKVNIDFEGGNSVSANVKLKKAEEMSLYSYEYAGESTGEG